MTTQKVDAGDQRRPAHVCLLATSPGLHIRPGMPR